MRKTLCLTLLVCLTLPLFSAFAAQTVLYTAKITKNYGETTTYAYEKQDKTSAKIASFKPGAKVSIVSVFPNYLGVLCSDGRVGYVLRHRVDNVEVVDAKNTPPYGVEVNRYFARVTATLDVRSAPEEDASSLITLTEGTMLSFIDITDGWARIIFKRQYGYVDTRLLSELNMIEPDPQAADDEYPIAAYTSFYNIAQTELNIGRMANLSTGCLRTNRVMQPGESLDFNGTVGPFSTANGYELAPVLVDGELKPGMGGGSCQVSSTLYNVVLQLPSLTVVERRPHGINGASYLPHGVDASSGDLNFVFRNDFDFPIRIDSHVQDGAMYIAVYKYAQ